MFASASCGTGGHRVEVAHDASVAQLERRAEETAYQTQTMLPNRRNLQFNNLEPPKHKTRSKSQGLCKW